LGALDVEVDVGDGVRQRNHRRGDVVARAGEGVLLGIPQRHDQGSPRGATGGDRPRDLDHRGDPGGIVRRAVADRVAPAPDLPALVRPDAVVVGADQDVLVGQVGSRHDGDDVGAEIELLDVAVDPPATRERRVGERRELLDQKIAGGLVARRPVVATAQPVARQHRDELVGRRPGRFRPGDVTHRRWRTGRRAVGRRVVRHGGIGFGFGFALAFGLGLGLGRDRLDIGSGHGELARRGSDRRRGSSGPLGRGRIGPIGRRRAVGVGRVGARRDQHEDEDWDEPTEPRHRCSLPHTLSAAPAGATANTRLLEAIRAGQAARHTGSIRDDAREHT
jgi:hypothetical protein